MAINRTAAQKILFVGINLTVNRSLSLTVFTVTVFRTAAFNVASGDYFSRMLVIAFNIVTVICTAAFHFRTKVVADYGSLTTARSFTTVFVSTAVAAGCSLNVPAAFLLRNSAGSVVIADGITVLLATA